MTTNEAEGEIQIRQSLHRLFVDLTGLLLCRLIQSLSYFGFDVYVLGYSVRRCLTVIPDVVDCFEPRADNPPSSVWRLLQVITGETVARHGKGLEDVFGPGGVFYEFCDALIERQRCRRLV